MKKLFLACLFLLGLCFLPFAHASAATQSSDMMILEWRAEKAWIDKGDLCLRGTFTNKRKDLSITKIDQFVTEITFTRADGSKYQYVAMPTKMPLVKISAGGARTVTFNLGHFEDTWKDWVATEDYTFTYITGKRW